MIYPPETNIAPENGWLEYDPFLTVSFREGTCLNKSRNDCLLVNVVASLF